MQRRRGLFLVVGLGGGLGAGKSAGAGAPECAENGVYDAGQDIEQGEVTVESFDEAGADAGDVFEDAASEGEGGEPLGGGLDGVLGLGVEV